MMELSDGVLPQHNFFDVAIASHLIDSVEGNPWFDEICRRHGIEIPGEGALLGRGGGARKLSQVPVEELSRWAGLRIQGLRRLASHLENRLRSERAIVLHRRPAAGLGLRPDGADRRRARTEAAGRFRQVAERKARCLPRSGAEVGGGKFDVDDPRNWPKCSLTSWDWPFRRVPKTALPSGPTWWLKWPPCIHRRRAA